MATPPGTIWKKVAIDALTPPQWVPVGNFAQGVQGPAGAAGKQGQQGNQGPVGPPLLISAIGSSLINPQDEIPFYSLITGANQQTTLDLLLSFLGRGYIDGMILSNDAVSPNTVLDIGAGTCTDPSNLIVIRSTTAFNKNCNAAWAVGAGNGGNFLNTTLAASTWYHVFAIRKTSGTFGVDFGIDTSVTGANAPAGYTGVRRIGSIKTDGSAHIIAFVQHGQEFYWAVPTQDVNATNPGTSAVTQTLNVPTGVVVKALSTYTCFTTSTYNDGYVSSLSVSDVVPGYSTHVFNIASDLNVESCPILGVWTNTSAQVRTRLSASAAGTNLQIWTAGWEDLRGRDQ